MKLNINMFTKQELIDAICKWMTDGIDCDTHLCDAANDLKSGKWLKYFEEQIASELPHSNS